MKCKMPACHKKKCCYDCADRYKCPAACLNSPEQCGQLEKPKERVRDEPYAKCETCVFSKLLEADGRYRKYYCLCGHGRCLYGVNEAVYK